MEQNYDFVKKFCAFVSNGDKCTITQFKPVKTKKGTKNNPSPFYLRDEGLDENDRYTLYAHKSYTFEYGKKYESVVEEGHVFMSQEEREQVKEKVDDACPILTRNKKTGTMCLDIVAPVSNGPANYCVKNVMTGQYVAVDDDFINESAKPWFPSSTHSSEVLFMQYALNTVVSLSVERDGETISFYNEKFVPTL